MKKEIRTARVDLADPFAGQHIVFRTNIPYRVFLELASKNLERALAALASMSIESDITNEDDQPIDVTTAAGWAELNDDGLGYIVKEMFGTLKAPKAMANGSSTQSLPEKEASLATSTT